MKALFLILLVAITSPAQSVVAHSSGADGALELTTPGIVVFDPKSFRPPLNPAGDNIFHFTTIHIGKDVTLRLSSKFLNGPVFWLASGPVDIEGTIDLTGEDGGGRPSSAGAGGYSGGAPDRPGYGPENFTPNVFLVPLVGGSGGAGGKTQGGGAGGGALLIASNVSITISGTILANGGASADGEGGGAGAIRLVAPLVDNSKGTLSARGGQPKGKDGFIRMESSQNPAPGNVNGTPFAIGKALGLFLPPNPPSSVRILSIGGVPVSGSEFNVTQSSSLTVAVEALNIPTGTVIELHFFSENGSDQIVKTAPLKGTLQLSRASVEVLFPAGFSRGYVRAAWNPQ